MVRSTCIMLVAFLLLSGTSAAYSDWVERIRGVVPAGITLTEVEETDGTVEMTGQARSNADIAALMRAIQGAELGRPELRQLKRNGEMRDFALRVKAPH